MKHYFLSYRDPQELRTELHTNFCFIFDSVELAHTGTCDELSTKAPVLN
jgi:hypothetical protein